MNIDINGLNSGNLENLRAKRNETNAPAQTKETASSNPAPQASSAQVSLSNTAQILSRAENSLKSEPDVDAERVAELRASIADGTYKSNPENMAQKMLDLE